MPRSVTEETTRGNFNLIEIKKTEKSSWLWSANIEIWLQHSRETEILRDLMLLVLFWKFGNRTCRAVFIFGYEKNVLPALFIYISLLIWIINFYFRKLYVFISVVVWLVFVPKIIEVMRLWYKRWIKICNLKYNSYRHDIQFSATLQDIFITYGMWRFSRNFAIFSDRQNFGRRNRIRRIISSLFQ